MKWKWLCALCVSSSLLTAPARADPLTHVRPMDTISALALERGLQESPRFRALVAELDASDVIVHVVASPVMPLGTTGTMRFVARLGDTRYIRVTLASQVTRDLRVVTLAHELHHACEVARSDAGSHDAVRRLYQSIGRAVPGRHEAFETDGAQVTAAAVWYELRGGRLTTRHASAP